MFAKAIDNGAMDCIECGICSYVCPTRRELVHWIKLAKAKHVRRSPALPAGRLGEGGKAKK
jgi:electron transport complex protein RnfC